MENKKEDPIEEILELNRREDVKFCQSQFCISRCGNICLVDGKKIIGTNWCGDFEPTKEEN